MSLPPIRLKRTNVAGREPPKLAEGEPAFCLVDPVRMWIGTPDGNREFGTLIIAIAAEPPTDPSKLLWFETTSNRLFVKHEGQWMKVQS